MKIELIAMGDHMPQWVLQGFDEYRKRLASHYSFKLTEIPLKKRSSTHALERILLEEKELLKAKITKGSYIIALDRTGFSVSSESFATKLKEYQHDNHHVVFLIGGPEGFHSEILQLAHEKWSFSAMTFPHPLIRIMFIEQLYRASMILVGHPYHK